MFNICCRVFLVFAALGASLAQAGIVVFRNEKVLQYDQAISVTVNGKDKVLLLGSDAKLNGPVGKLQDAKLGAPMFLDLIQGVVALHVDRTIDYIYPAGLPKTAGDPSAAWKSSRISWRRSASEKTPVEIPAVSLLAYLPGGVEELVALCNDDAVLDLIGGRGKAFATKMELMSSAVKAFPGDPALVGLERFVTKSLAESYGRFETGIARAELIDQALKLVELSGVVYPTQPEQVKLREQILARKAWLDRRLAVLRAFSGAGEWDSFVLGDQDVEKYHQAFPEVAQLHTQALKASLESHRQAGEQLLAEKEFEPAWREFRIASLRQPSDKILQQKVLMSWTDYSRQSALDNKKRKQLSSGEREAMNQALQFAAGYQGENKLDLAYKSVLEAEKIDPDALQVLLKKAEILGAQRDFDLAFATLDRYDLRAVDEEREKASSLRNTLLFKRTSSLEDLKTQVATLWNQGSFNKARELSLQGLRAAQNDSELLYRAGMSLLVTRSVAQSRDMFRRYLDVSNTLDGDAGQRMKVRALLPGIRDVAPPDTAGETNWMSGRRLPAGIFYCPTSLAFQPRVDRVEASGKMSSVWDWRGDQLASITPVFEKPENATGERKVLFGYDDRLPQIAFAGVADGGSRPAPSTDPDELYKRASVVLANNPYIDPVATAMVTGKNIAIGVAGNRFFEPFVWDKVHYFRLEYDGNSRVVRARELVDAGGVLGDIMLEFDWNGMQLTAIHGYQGRDEKQRSKIYDRTLQYQDGRLISEEIQSQSRTSHIKYTYNGGRLISASCDRDFTLDDRSRQVAFK